MLHRGLNTDRVRGGSPVNRGPRVGDQGSRGPMDTKARVARAG